MLSRINRNPWSLKVLPPINNPLHTRDDQDDPKRDDTVVHRCARDRQERREQEQHRRDNRVDQPDDIRSPSKPSW